jgi:hypothetical protein
VSRPGAPPVLALALAAALGCASGRATGAPPPPPAGRSEEAAREVLRRFAGAVEAGRWGEAHALLAARWRAAYTPARLAVDFGGAGPAGRESAERLRAALAAGAPLARDGGRALLPVGGGRAAVLVAEEGGWRVDAIE